jgi:hypothetical protein
VSGDGPAIESAVDSCVNSIVTLTSATTTTVASGTTTTTTTPPSESGCCSFPAQGSNIPAPGCTMDTALCPNVGGTLMSGVCRNDGTCGTATGPGDCCDFAPEECFVLAAQAPFTKTSCSLVGGTFTSSGVCTAMGCQ